MWDYNVHKRIIMKQYLTPEQTAKLIELGFDRPKSIEEYTPKEALVCLKQRYAYSIGELMKMLPKIHPLYHDPYCLDIGFDTVKWIVGYTYDNGYVEVVNSYELIDALYEMVVKLKEEGVI